MIGTRFISLAAAAFMAGALVACSDAAGSRTGKLTLLLTDQPGVVQAAVVTISEIYLQGNGGSGRLVLMDTPVTVDLLTLSNSTLALVEDEEIPAGRYAQLRFVITGAYLAVETEEGGMAIYASSPTYAGLPPGVQATGALQMPSYAQTGIKVNLPGGGVTIGGSQKIMLVDFDVSRSFGHQAGQSGMWVMHPVLEATDFTTSGSVEVVLDAVAELEFPEVDGSQIGLGDFRAVLFNDDGSHEELVLTDVDEDGSFSATFKYLIPGSWKIGFAGPDGVGFTTDPAVPLTVVVAAGQHVTREFELLAVGN